MNIPYRTMDLPADDEVCMYFPRLRSLREARGMTQAQIAEILHCQREVYRRYETGYRQLPVDLLIVLANYYHVTTDYILGLDARGSQKG